MMLRLCLWALALYPHAWRTRYEAELQALLEVREVSAGTLIDLIRGAFDAHVNPRGVIASPRQRMRGSLAATVGCWIATMLLGAGFAKATEDAPFRQLGLHHAALADARLWVAILAFAGALVIALAGAPLVYAVLRQAWRERTPTLVRAIATAASTAVMLTAATGALVAVSHSVRLGHLFGHALLIVWSGVAVAAAIGCALAARAGLMATRFKPGPLVLGVAGAWLLARIISALTVAVATYVLVLMVTAPTLAASPNGPLRLSTSIVLISQLVGMAAISTLATVTTRRGMRALRGR